MHLKINATEKLFKDKKVTACDKTNLSWFWVGYGFYPTRTVFPVPSPRLRDRKQTTRLIKTTPNAKPREVLYL